MQQEKNKEAQFQELVTRHLYVVKIIALKISAKLPPTIELEDLIHTGILGLIDAAQKYDPGKGTKFATYASVRIKGAILDELRNLDWATRTMRQKIKEVEAAFETLEHKLCRPATEEEVAESLNMNIVDFHRLLDESKGVGIGVFRLAAEHDAGLSDEMTLDYFADENSNSPALQMERAELKNVLGRFVAELPDRERLVLSLYYSDDLNLKEIGATLDLTESRISQIRTQAILRLRAKFAELAGQNGVNPGEIV